MTKIAGSGSTPKFHGSGTLLLITIGKQVKHSKALSHSVAVPDQDPLDRGTYPDQAPDPSIEQKQ
jgi:hypothetical protein